MATPTTKTFRTLKFNPDSGAIELGLRTTTFSTEGKEHTVNRQVGGAVYNPDAYITDQLGIASLLWGKEFTPAQSVYLCTYSHVAEEIN